MELVGRWLRLGSLCVPGNAGKHPQEGHVSTPPSEIKGTPHKHGERMTTPIVWKCYGCSGPVPMCEDGPLKWFELTDYKPGEIQAVACICDQFPKCSKDSQTEDFDVQAVE